MTVQCTCSIGCQPEKRLLYTVANPARDRLNGEKRTKRSKSGSAPYTDQPGKVVNPVSLSPLGNNLVSRDRFVHFFFSTHRLKQ